jgi:hypothetical protein
LNGGQLAAVLFFTVVCRARLAGFSYTPGLFYQPPLAFGSA